MKYIQKAAATLGVFALVMVPMVASAQFELTEFRTSIGRITDFINNVIIPLIFAISLVVFIWGMFRYFIHKGAADAEQGKELIKWSIIGFVMMVSIWGIVNLIANGLGFSGEQIQNIPDIPTSNN